MPDMDLREVLAEALHHIRYGDNGTYDTLRETRMEAVAMAARLSQPDVLNEFERRANRDATTGPLRDTTRPADPEAVGLIARQVLSDMLGGGS